MYPSIEQRFNAKVRRSDRCWEWTAFKGRQGYGLFRFEGTMKLAHRVAYIFAYGSIPSGMDVLHRCDNPSCVRPEHLFPGTALDNIRDMQAKGRAPSNAREENGRAKLNEELVAQIRQLFRCGGTKRGLARQFGVNARQIDRIVKGEQWAA